jgi:hypothetical protein
MDGAMNLIPDPDADALYNEGAALFAAEWELVKATKNKKLMLAHGRTHHFVANAVAKLGIPSTAGGVHTDSGGGDKPPHPQ